MKTNGGSIGIDAMEMLLIGTSIARPYFVVPTLTNLAVHLYVSFSL